MGRYDLGMSEAEFWATSPRVYRALLDRQREVRRAEQDAANLRAGVIAAAVSNVFGGKKGGGSFSAKDFFRFDQQTQPRPRDSKVPLQVQEQAAIQQGWMNWLKSVRAVEEQKALVAGK